MLRRMLRSAAAVLTAALALARQDHHEVAPRQQRLGVVAPAYKGDLARTVSSLKRWPTECSPLTLANADLVLYYAQEESSATASALESISSTAGRCFSRTRIVFANLAQEDDIYPRGPSIMFYNMFLDEDVRSSLSEYDALSIVEWDVLVASDNSFEELYHAAFRVNEEFWVKGSNLEGTSFHSTAEASEMWQVLGHINGNAIYNNDDPAFVEYVEYTRARWGYEHPYDVALWMTISDFPYSWPLYQRYSSKFVVTNLISSVGFEHVGHDTVSDAVAGQTLFIHGSSVEEGNVASFRAAAAAAVAFEEPEPAQQSSRKLTSVPKWKTAEKWKNGNDDGTPKWKSNQKWKNKNDGSEPKWRTNQKWKNRNDSSDDSSSSDSGSSCSSRCAYTSKDGTKGRVCDSNCSSPNVYGTKGCLAKQGIYGADCRVCYNNVDRALKQDSPDNRAIMCSTLMPVDVYRRRMSAADEGEAPRVARSLEALKEDASSPSEEESGVKVDQDRKLTSVPKWKAEEKWRTANDDGIPKWQRNQKWKTKDDGSEPKWRTNQKWKNRNDSSDDSSSSDPGCSSRCAYTSKDGTKGRVCDSNCSMPNVYGTKGCNAKQGIYGADCRVCYNNVDRALKQDSPDNRAIMCSTVMPVDAYGRRMSAAEEGLPSFAARGLKALQEDASSLSWKASEGRELTSVPKWKAEEKWRNANDDGVPKWKSNQKWKTKKDDGNEPKWRTNQKWKNRNDSSDDSSSSDAACSSRCAYTSKDGTKGRVCDSNCSSPNVYGTKGCNAKQGIYGADCRVCYNNVDRALKQDSPDNRAIICSTVKPVDVYRRRMAAPDESEPARVARSLAALKENASSPAEEVESAVKVNRDRELTSVPKWKATEKWRTANDDSIPKWQRSQKWKTKNEDGSEPKWRTNQKWKNRNDSSDDSSSSDAACSSRCAYTSKDGTKGRVCDSNCSSPNVYGTKGCGAKQGIYGADCRVCYNNVDRALKQDSPDNRAIMCSTVMPVDVYGRRLSASDDSDPFRVAKMIEAEDVGNELSVDVDMEKAIRFFEEAAERPYSQDLKRGNLCAFVGGRVGEEAMWEVTVKSILQFMPGMRLAIAAEADGLGAYKRSMGGLPGVTISSTQSPATAALFADRFCGAGTALILYVEPGSVLSRPFASKDTHSPRGDLLVVHTGSQGSYHDAQLRSRSASVLGFDAPSFTHGTDLMLPMGTNEALRESLGLRRGASLQHDGDGASLIALQELVGFDPVSAVPQVLAALAYSRETPGVWFVDPQAWVGQNLFKEASIWDVPLVKPRYACAIAPAQLKPRSPNTAEVLQSNLDFFSKGGKCANGLIDVMP